MELLFADGLPPAGRGRYVQFDHRRQEGAGWEFCDLRELLDRRQERWLAELDAWHRELSALAAAASPDWWLLPGSRLAVWYPKDLKPLFFALAAAEVCASAPEGTLALLGCPPEVREYLEEWTRTPAGSGHRVAGTAARAPVTGRLHAALAWLRRRAQDGRLALGLLARALPGWLGRARRIGKARLLVFSYTLKARNLFDVGDHYFGDAVDALPGFAPGEVLWLYYLDFIGERDLARRFLESRGRRSLFYFELLRPGDLVKIAAECLQVAARLRPLGRRLPALRIGRFESRLFPLEFFDDCVRGRLPILELSVRRALGRALELTGAQAVLYPYEEKGIERAILAASAGKGARTAAFAHAVYKAGHLYLRRRPGPGEPPRPDLVAATGPAMRDWLVRKAGWEPERVVSVGSPRHPGQAEPQAPSADRKRRLKVLFLAGHGCEVGMLAEFASREPGLFAGCELWVRKYPYGWDAPQAEGLERLARLVAGLRTEEGFLEEQIRWCDAALFNSSSSGVHAILRGRPALQAALHDAFPSDPTEDKGEAGALERCATAAGLKSALERLKSMDDAAYLALARRQIDYAESLYAPLDRAALAALASGAAGAPRERVPA